MGKNQKNIHSGIINLSNVILLKHGDDNKILSNQVELVGFLDELIEDNEAKKRNAFSLHHLRQMARDMKYQTTLQAKHNHI